MDALPSGTGFVDAFVIDLNGLPRGKRLPAADWTQAVQAGVGFSASALVLDARGNAQGPGGIGTSDGDPDATAFPVDGMLAPVPWSTHRVAQCLMSMKRGEASLWFDPRFVLQAVVDRLRADRLHPVVACELEFCLVEVGQEGLVRAPGDRPGRQAGNAGHLCLQTVEDHGAFLHALHAALAAQGVGGGALVSEYGAGQFELNLRHGSDPVRAADQAVLQRRAARGVAASLGLRASFMAKPYKDQPGSGLHVHLSLVDEAGRNRLGGEGGQALLEGAIAGMQALHAQSMAFFAPSFSAYRRYRGGAFVAARSSWGEDNRSVAFRLPQGPAPARRIEHRVAAADASPHLVMAAILAAAHHGITRGLLPGAACRGRDTLPPDPALPSDIFAALRALEAPGALHAYLPPGFAALFAAVKRGETNDLLEEVQPVEHAFYL